MSEKAYRGLSPVFAHEKDGTVTRLISAALTNAPNLKQLATLHTTKQPGDNMDLFKIRARLGLPETADEAAVLAAIDKANETVTAHTSEIAKLTASTAPLDQVVALQTKLDTLTAERAKEKAVAFVDGAIKLGKPIVAVREQFIAQHVADPAAAEATINGLPSINAGGAGGGGVVLHTEDGQLTKEELAICTRMGQDPTKYKEFKKKQQASEGSAV